MDGISVSAFAACAAAQLRGGTHTVPFATVQNERSLIKCERSVRGMRTQSLPVWLYRALKSAPLTQKESQGGWNLDPMTSTTSVATQKSALVFILLIQRTTAEVRPNRPSRRTSGLRRPPAAPTRAQLFVNGTTKPHVYEQTDQANLRVRERIHSALRRNLQPTSAVPKGVRTPTER